MWADGDAHEPTAGAGEGEGRDLGVLRVDGREIENLADFKKVYDELVESGKRLIMLDVKRGARMPFVLLKQGAEVTQEDEDKEGGSEERE